MSVSSSSTSTSSCSPRGAETGMIDAHSRSSETATSCSATLAFDVASVFVTIATFLARGYCSSCSLMYRSPGPMASLAGTQNAITSTSPSVDCTSELRRSPRSVRGRCRPGVSTRISCPCSRCTMPRMARRVVCGFELVIATFSPTRAFVSVDLPTFGRPTIETNPARYSATVVPFHCIAFVERGLRVDEGLVGLDEDRRDALPSALGALSLEHEARDARPLSGLRQPAELLREQAARRIDVFVIEVESEQLAELVDRQPRVHAEPPVAEVFDLCRLAVVLVGDVAHEFLDDVFEGHEAGDAAVLVDDHGEMVRLELHLAEQCIGLHRVGHEHRRAHELADGEVVGVERPLEPEAREIAEIQDAADVVGVTLDHGNARIPGLQEQGHGLPEVRGGVDRDHVGARHHHLADDGVVELEDRVDELAVALFEHVELGCLVDHAEQLLLAGDARESDASGRHAIAQGDERVRERSEQDPQEVHE